MTLCAKLFPQFLPQSQHSVNIHSIAEWDSSYWLYHCPCLSGWLLCPSPQRWGSCQFFHPELITVLKVHNLQWETWWLPKALGLQFPERLTWCPPGVNFGSLPPLTSRVRWGQSVWAGPKTSSNGPLRGLRGRGNCPRSWAAAVDGVTEPRQLGRLQPCSSCVPSPGLAPSPSLRSTPFPRPRWTQPSAASTPMATSLRRPSFTTGSSSPPDADDEGVWGTWENASLCKRYLPGAGLGVGFPWVLGSRWEAGLCLGSALLRQKAPVNLWNICEPLLGAGTHLLN